MGGRQLGRLADLAVPGLESITCEPGQKNLKLFQRAALRFRQVQVKALRDASSASAGWPW